MSYLHQEHVYATHKLVTYDVDDAMVPSSGYCKIELMKS